MKRLICCLDGTWNDDKNEDALTNVVKLRRAIPAVDAHGIRQVVHYVVGIGTGYSGQLGFAVGASGIEVGDRVKAGYKFLVENYDDGDEIYLFGFSRGAFEARSLAGFIALAGIGRPDSAFSIDQAWQIYRRRESHADPGAIERLRADRHYPARIKCVGVWDTVGNLGNPLRSSAIVRRLFDFHDTQLSDQVDVGLHALSIDERRAPFSPTLWTLPRGAVLPAGQVVEQVWFAGVHADVGGGYKETELSDIALLWMAERCVALTGLGIDFDYLARVTRPNPIGMQHGSAHGRIFKWSAKVPFVRLVRQDRRGVWTPRRITLRDWRTSRAQGGQVPVNEAIHESALTRFGKTVVEDINGKRCQIVYRPRNLAAALRTSKGMQA